RNYELRGGLEDRAQLVFRSAKRLLNSLALADLLLEFNDCALTCNRVRVQFFAQVEAHYQDQSEICKFVDVRQAVAQQIDNYCAVQERRKLQQQIRAEDLCASPLRGPEKSNRTPGSQHEYENPRTGIKRIPLTGRSSVDPEGLS